MQTVELTALVEKLKLKNLTPEIDMTEIKINTPDIKRPALQIAGYFDHFASERVQIIGYVEYTYLKHLSKEQRVPIYEKFLSSEIPCVIFSSLTEPDEEFYQLAVKYNKPLLATDKGTSQFMADIIRALSAMLAPCISIHGVLVDVYGEGVLIMGESGIGKSEAALELVKRGHRLVTDDVVEIRKVDEDTLIGKSPAITRHFIEVRGIGIVDIKELFGVSSIRESKQIDMVIRLEEWDKDKEYDRLGLEAEYTEFSGTKIVSHTLPVRPGRNLAVILETAAANNRQKKLGYNAAQELYRRVQESIAGKGKK